MKKPLLLGLAISLALGVTACSSSTDANKEVPKNEQQSQESSNDDKKESSIEKQYIFGKVKGIVGNEIEFELAKDPGKDIEAVEKDEEVKEEMKNEMPTITMTPAQKSGEGDSKVNVGDIEANNPLVDLEFTGEEKTITLPTGVSINVLSGRSGEGLAVIKEGTYLKLEVDDSKSENPSVFSVDVIS